MVKRQKVKLSDFQKQRVMDCVDSLRLYAIPEKWKMIPGFQEQVRKALVNVSKGLAAAGIPCVDIKKAIECIDYGRKDLAYRYLFESSTIKDPIAQQLDARLGIGSGPGALNELHFLIMG